MILSFQKCIFFISKNKECKQRFSDSVTLHCIETRVIVRFMQRKQIYKWVFKYTSIPGVLMNPNVLQNKTNIKIFREKTFSFELDLNQRFKDSCLTPHYSPPLYQLSYRRVIYTTVDGNTLVGFLTTGLHCGIFNYICNKRQCNKATKYQSFCELLKYNKC